MTRMRRGWELTKKSWAVVRRDRSLMVFPVVAVISALLVALIFIGGGVALYGSNDSEPLLIVILVIGAYVLIAVSIFFSVALSACAARALEGHDTRASEGFAAARERFGQIIGWAGLSSWLGRSSASCRPCCVRARVDHRRRSWAAWRGSHGTSPPSS